MEGGTGPFRLHGHVLPSGERRDVYVSNGTIGFDPVPGATTLSERGWILPGLVDCHAHLALNSPAPRAAPPDRVRASARAHLEAGVLVVREPGSPDRSSASLAAGEGLPRVITAGRFLAPPGGYMPGLARDVAPEGLAQAVSEEARASGAWVKLVGDFLGPEGRIRPNWRPEDLKAATRAAHDAGARIAIHATHPQAIGDAIEAGFDSIEHGNGLQQDHIEAMAERGVAWVPTLTIDELILPFFERGLTPEGRREVRSWIDAHPGRVAAAVEAGVRVLAGTDAGMVAHGIVGNEVALLLRAGVPAERALGAASWDARDWLGLPGIEEGAPADLVVFEEDPIAHAAAIGRPAITILAGRMVGKHPIARVK